MLDGLDKVNWGALNHAYGPATDVPDMIRMLASSDEDERGEALHAAYGNIFHQGTRYTATPHAIPFLVQIAARQGPGTRDLLQLVCHCVAGYFSTTYGPVTGSGPIWSGSTRPMEDYGETVELLHACERAAESALPVCVRLFEERDAPTRMAALRLVAALHAYAERYEMVPRLEGMYRQEADVDVRAMIAFALTHLLPVGKESVLVEIARGDADELVRVVAAMGCIRRDAVTGEMTADLFRWLEDDELGARYEDLPCHDEDLAGDLGALLTLLDRAVLASALPALVEKLRVADDFGVCGVLAAALTAVFGDERAPADGAALTAEQRMVIEALVQNQAFWSIGNAMSILHDHGLPGTRARTADLFGMQIEEDPVEAARIGARMFRGFGAELAAEEWTKVLEKFPGDAEALCQLGVLHAELGEDDAVELLERGLANAASLRPAVVGQAYFALGIVRFKKDELERAYDAFTQAQAKLRGAECDQARSNRVAILQRLGRAAEALALLEEKPARTSDDHYHLGLAQVKAGRYPECIASITRVLDAEPDHALAHYTIACAYALSGDRERALRSIERALDCDPGLAEAIAHDPDFASIGNDPRFEELVGAAD